MGQYCTGVLLGCVQPKGVAMRADEAPGLLDRYEAIMGAKHRAAFRKDWRHARDRLVPDAPYGGTEALVGFWVAGVEEHDNDSHEEVETIALADLVKTPRFKRAAKAWMEFTTWAKTQGIKLPRARLYLTQNEVG
jgi:hypothetical protein